MEVKMGSLFGTRLRAAREAIGLSQNGLAKRSNILQGTMAGIEGGDRPPSRANLEALAAVKELGIGLEILQAWADADRIGIEGLERIKKHAPELLDFASRKAVAETTQDYVVKPKRKKPIDRGARVAAHDAEDYTESGFGDDPC